MAKWADYLISAVQFETTAKTKHISKVKVHVDDGTDKIPAATIWTRQEVITALDNNDTFVTIEKNGTSYDKGAKVFKIKIGTTYYIKTRSDDETEDNLDNMPAF